LGEVFDAQRGQAALRRPKLINMALGAINPDGNGP